MTLTQLMSMRWSILASSLKQINRRCLASTTTNRPPSYLHHIGENPLVYRTIGQQLARAVDRFGDHEAIVSCEQNIRYTFAEVMEKADRLAAAFHKLGLKRGDKFGIWSTNSAEWYVLKMAVARAGLVTVALNPAYQGPELAYALQKVGIRAIYAPEAHKWQNYYAILKSIVPELEHSADRKIVSKEFDQLQTVIIDSKTSLPGAHTFNDMLHLADTREAQRIADEQHLIVADDPCNIQFTSGTTGKPKAAVVSHFSVVNNGIHIAQRTELDTKHHKICVQNQFFHAFGVVVAAMAALANGTTLVLPVSGYDTVASLRAIENEKCTVVYGTPTMFVDLLDNQKKLNRDVSSLELGTTGGAPCSPQLFNDIKTVLGLRAIKTVFGLTETSAASFFSLPGESDEKSYQTLGHLVDHLEAKIVDPLGQLVPMGSPGELYIRGYSTMLGYYGDVEKTLETISPDKWLRTGDQCSLTEDGYGRIIGRLKDFFIRGGENIYPKEIEDFLNTHPEVLECHVYGVPDRRLGEDVAANIRTTEKGRSLVREDIKTFCKGRLAHYKVPRYIRLVDDFPKTLTGKIQRYKLREEFERLAEEDPELGMFLK